MQSIDIQFDTTDFATIFPFYILMNEDLVIVAHGPSINIISASPLDQPFGDFFNINRPSIESLSLENIKGICNQLIILQAKTKKNNILRGQFSFRPKQHQILFVGSAWFESSEGFTESGLSLFDYAPHNSSIDLLHLLKTQHIANAELVEVLSSLKSQKAELEKVQKELIAISSSLEDSNMRYEYVNKATSEAIWDWNMLTGEMYYGDGFEKLFGYVTHKQKGNFNTWEKRIHPNDLDRVMNNIHAFIDDLELNKWTAEYQYLKSDGTYAYVIDKGFIIRDLYGNAIRMIGTMQDITAQKLEEQHLRLLESVIVNTNDGIIITKASRGNPIIYINESFTKMTGYTFAELEGRSPNILQGLLTDDLENEKLRKAVKDYQPCEINTINYKKNGETFWANIIIKPIANSSGVYTHWIAITRDFTEIKSMSESLENQKNFYDEILNNIPTDIAVFDPKHNYIFLNPYAVRNEEIRKWMINKNDLDYAKMKGIDNSIAMKRWDYFERAVASKSTVQWVDEHKTTEGKSNFVLRNLYPFFQNNELKFVIGYGIDVTERKLAENKLIEALENLRKTNLELEQFAYVASHDLQEPLRMVTSFLTQLEKKYESQLDDKAKEYIYYAVDGAKRMRQIILDLLAFSRAGKDDEMKGPVDLNDIVDEIKVLYKQKISETKTIIHCPVLPTVSANKTPIRQVFQNLISNAIKYGRSDVAPEIDILCEKKEDCWEIIFKDNGIGIEAAYYDKIFVIFQRLHNKNEYEGSGIGLAITKKIMESMGGKIWVTANENHGSSFHITIPFSA